MHEKNFENRSESRSCTRKTCKLLLKSENWVNFIKVGKNNDKNIKKYVM
ncbi:unnamed protein product [Meloidogyne enterolobii]|uniref:Uncharacterized protein n=1 Tax=Meloidogyne enterolobii TaxID=390850 RepID=A0ACB0ZQ06_MELEN